MTVPVDTQGFRGHTLAVVIFFHDAAGNPISSVLPGYGDETAQIRVVSQNAVVARDREGFDFVFRVPYGAFPRRGPGRYEVEGRVRVIERSPTGSKSLLATGSVRFFVES
jgi:hypothetical protein